MRAKAIAFVLALSVLATAVVVRPGVAQQAEVLRVALYPYVPLARELFFKLEAAFEADHPGVNVELVESTPGQAGGLPVPLADDYYDGGLLRVEADVYEIDTVLLPDMVAAGKIAPIVLPQADFVPEARQAVQFNGSTWGVPHWVCGNFLFYRAGDTAVADATTWDELVAAVGSHPWFIDLKGTSTLGEWYLTAIAGMYGDPGSVLRELAKPTLDQAAVSKLQTLLQPCPPGYCRSRAFHDRAGYYARQFARGRARAYIGYSETLHYALQEIADSCGPADGCRAAGEIAVRSLPVLAPQGRPVGWVDAFGVSATIGGRKKDLALKFIEFATSWRAYQLVLNPEWPTAPRYLLPALRLDPQKAQLTPPLYPALSAAFGNRLILTATGLNETLRKRGKALECALPPERGDAKWMKECHIVPTPTPTPQR